MIQAMNAGFVAGVALGILRGLLDKKNMEDFLEAAKKDKGTVIKLQHAFVLGAAPDGEPN